MGHAIVLTGLKLPEVSRGTPVTAGGVLTSLSSEMGTFRDVASWVARAHLLLLLRFLFLEFRGFGEREIFVSFSTPQV